MINLYLYYLSLFKNIIFQLKFSDILKIFNLKLNLNSKNNYFDYEVIRFKNHDIALSSNMGDICSLVEIFSFNEYEGIFKLIKNNNIKPFCLIDLGANIGLTYVYFNNMNLVKKYIGVEPYEKNNRLLNFNAFSNKSTLINKAVWIDDKGVNFSNSRENNSNYVTNEGNLRVETLTLLQILRDINNEDIFLKMDIEGAEYPILEKDLELIEKKVKYFAIEFHDIKKNNYQKLVDSLSKNFEILESVKEDIGFSLVFGVNKNI